MRKSISNRLVKELNKPRLSARRRVQIEKKLAKAGLGEPVEVVEEEKPKKKKSAKKKTTKKAAKKDS
jgi:hypothetical protein